MKAVILDPRPDGAAISVQEIPIPQPGEGQVLVAVHAAALNRGELGVRRQLVSGPPQGNGIEFAGEVVEIGSSADASWMGRRVMGHWRAGQAEYVAVDQRLLVQVPDRLTWVQAAAWLNVFTTAHDAIVSRAGLQRGESILINAAASGIGTAALQIARLLGASPVLGTSRSRSRLEPLHSLGMNIGIDSSSPGWPDAVLKATGGKGVDVIIDSVGADALGPNLASAALGARIVSVGRLGAERGEIDLDLLAYKRISLFGVTFRTRSLEQRAGCVQRCAKDLLPALSDGLLEPVVHCTFPMTAIDQAHQYMSRDAHFGKIVLVVRE